MSKIVPGLLVNQIIETKVNSYFTLFRKWSSGIIYMCITKGMAKQIVIPILRIQGSSFSDTDSSTCIEIEIFLRQHVTRKTKKLHNL